MTPRVRGLAQVQRMSLHMQLSTWLCTVCLFSFDSVFPIPCFQSQDMQWLLSPSTSRHCLDSGAVQIDERKLQGLQDKEDAAAARRTERAAARKLQEQQAAAEAAKRAQAAAEAEQRARERVALKKDKKARQKQRKQVGPCRASCYAAMSWCRPSGIQQRGIAMRG